MKIFVPILKSIGAGIFAKISILLIRIFQVPLLISLLGMDDFGRWLLLYSIPSWLSLSNLGFGNVAANEISIAISNQNTQKASKVFSSAFFFISLVSILIFSLVVIFSKYLPWYIWLNTSEKRNSELVNAIIYLGGTTTVSFFFDIIFGKFRAAQKAHWGILAGAVRMWMEFCAIFLFSLYSKSLSQLALVLLIANVLFFILYLFLSSRLKTNIIFSFKLIDFSMFKDFLKKGLSFQAFPLSNAILFQGTLVVVQHTLGPVAVATFGTIRTLVRTINQFFELLSQASWPEISHLYGNQNWKQLSKLHRTNIEISILAGCMGIIIFSFFGKTLYQFWIQNQALLNSLLLFVFLLPIPFNALWNTSVTISLATNQHTHISKYYLVVNLVAFILCFFLTKRFHLYGTAISMFFIDILMVPIVLNSSLKIIKSSISALIRDIRQDFYFIFKIQ